MFDVKYESPDVLSCCILKELLPQWITAAGEECNGSSYFVEEEKQPVKLIKEE